MYAASDGALRRADTTAALKACKYFQARAYRRALEVLGSVVSPPGLVTLVNHAILGLLIALGKERGAL